MRFMIALALAACGSDAGPLPAMVSCEGDWSQQPGVPTKCAATCTTPGELNPGTAMDVPCTIGQATHAMLVGESCAKTVNLGDGTGCCKPVQLADGHYEIGFGLCAK